MNDITKWDIGGELEVRSETQDGEPKVIKGYFAKYGQIIKRKNHYEEIGRNAFKNIKESDVRALLNHDDNFVLGRNKNSTLELRTDDVGLYGTIKLNENDNQAMDIHARVERGDIDQCSFGFRRIKDTCVPYKGLKKYILEEVDVREVSVVTFPAYRDTHISTRDEQDEQSEIEQDKEMILSVIKNRRSKK